jgi:hypothetical protein
MSAEAGYEVPAALSGSGVVVDHLPASTQQYVGSPAIAVLPDGDYVMSHDIFGPGSSNDSSLVFRSGDRGKTWSRIARVQGQWWSTLFWHQGALHWMGVSCQYGNVVIRRSGDGGVTWTQPTTNATGLLLDDGRYHCAPVPVVVHNGRVWRTMEDASGPGSWGHHFRAFMMSAPQDADLLQAESWTCSNPIGRDPEWLNGTFGGWLEGNAVVTPAGSIVDFLRVDVPPGPEQAAIVQVSDDGAHATFCPDSGFVEFPGGAKKFTIRLDPDSGLYWSLTNPVPEQHRQHRPGKVRNTLALVCSPDLYQWDYRATVLHHPDVEYHGFQYVDWLFDGDDLIVASRTAFDDGLGGAHNQHDANYLTFHRVQGFREQTSTKGDHS